jgi:hypothetical protein
MISVGVTMRLASRGVLEFDISASISYQPNTGAVNALLHGCTSYQQDQIGKQLQYLCVLARHPLLLPTILAEMRLNSIKDLADKMWRFLLYVETRSGQTGAPALNAHKHQKSGESMNWAKLAVDALAVMQIAAAMEDHANGLQVSIGEMRKMLDDLGRAAQLILFLPPP